MRPHAPAACKTVSDRPYGIGRRWGTHDLQGVGGDLVAVGVLPVHARQERKHHEEAEEDHHEHDVRSDRAHDVDDAERGHEEQEEAIARVEDRVRETRHRLRGAGGGIGHECPTGVQRRRKRGSEREEETTCADDE